MFLAASWAAVEVSLYAGDECIGVLSGEFEFDVAVDLGEAFVAANVGFR